MCSAGRDRDRDAAACETPPRQQVGLVLEIADDHFVSFAEAEAGGEDVDSLRSILDEGEHVRGCADERRQRRAGFFAPLHVESVLPGVIMEVAQKAGDRVFSATRQGRFVR